MQHLINLNCECCGQAFEVKYYRQNIARFCSRSCQGKVLLNTPEVHKKIAKAMKGKHYPHHGIYWKHKTSEHLKKIGIAKQKYFNLHPETICGENNPNWRGGTTPAHRLRLTRKAFRHSREVALKRDENKCVKCGSSYNLHVHHLLAWRDGGTDNPENLQTLCQHCHMTIEAEKREELLREAIAKKCHECIAESNDRESNDRESNPADCTAPLCPLYPFRSKTLRTQKDTTKQGGS